MRPIHIHAFAAINWIPEFNFTTDPKTDEDRTKMKIGEHKGHEFWEISTCILCVERKAGFKVMWV